MNIINRRTDDPIAPELLRARLEAVGQEAGAAVEQTAISPVVTESKDYSVTICDAEGALISATGVNEVHFGASIHAVRTTIAKHGDSIAEGDVFIANDPHSGGGVHPQDVVIQRPVFFNGQRVAWVALAAHMMDMGGMVPGSSAAEATECYQEALRLPPVRLFRQHQENTDIWEILRINIRSSALVEMDVRSLVIGGAVAEAKLIALLGEMGIAAFEAAVAALLAGTARVLRARISDIEDGRYSSIARVEFREALLRIPCALVVSGDRLLLDLMEAPPQVPHFFNSKAYILRAAIVPKLRQSIAPGLPFSQAFYDAVEIATKKGSIVDSVMPAPIAAAHMDAAMAVMAAAGQCLQLAIHASPKAVGRKYFTAPAPAAYGVGRWNYLDESGQRRVYTVIDGALCGSGAGHDRNGVDLLTNLTPSGGRFEYADAEILESAYPVLFLDRSLPSGAHGHGRHRSGAGFKESFRPHGLDKMIGNLTGTRAWFPAEGGAGGLPGAPMRFSVTRADGKVEKLHLQTVGVVLGEGDAFELQCASGGGFGDPLDRDPADITDDLREGLLDMETAREVYGAVFGRDGELDLAATESFRDALRQERLGRAVPAVRPVTRPGPAPNAEALPLYPGVVQRGDAAVAEASGAILAIAPDNWLDGCPTIETELNPRAGGIISRAHLDPKTGRMLFVDILIAGEGPGMEIRPDRWATAQAS